MKRLPALLCALVLVAAACGGDEGTETTTATAETTTTTTTAPATTTAAPSTTAAETTTTTEAVEEIDLSDPANWPLEAPELELPVTFIDAIGNEVTVTKADRIGSLYGTATEILWTIGLGDRLVIIDSTSQYPPDFVADIATVGFFRVLPAEGIIAQTPDVVFLSPDAGPPETIEAMEAAGIVLVRVPYLTGDVATFEEMVDLIGVATGVPEHASAFGDAVLAGIGEATVEVADDAPVVMFTHARAQSILLTGLDSSSNAIIEAAGYRSVAALLGLEGSTPLTPEAIVAIDPDVIVTTASSMAQAGGAEAFLAVPGIAETTAGKNGALVVWEDDAGIMLWTPRTPSTLVHLRELVEESTG